MYAPVVREFVFIIAHNQFDAFYYALPNNTAVGKEDLAPRAEPGSSFSAFTYWDRNAFRTTLHGGPCSSKVYGRLQFYSQDPGPVTIGVKFV